MPPKRKSSATKAKNMAKKRAMEDPETRENRLSKQRLRQAYSRARETTPERIQRLTQQRIRQSSLRARLAKNSRRLKYDAVPTERLATKGLKRSRLKKSKNKKSEETLSKKRKGQRRSQKLPDAGALGKCNYITCCALACTNTSESHVLIRLPLDLERRQQWLSRIKREAWTTCKNSAICQIHFEADVWEKNVFGEKILKDGVLPTLNLHGEATKSRVTLNKSSNVTDELARNSNDDEPNDEERESSLYIKQEALEPDIEVLEGPVTGKESSEPVYLDCNNKKDMLEETPSVKERFETVYLESNIDKLNDELIGNTNIKMDELNKSHAQTIAPEIHTESIKAEPLNILEDVEQTISTLSCPKCNQYFEEKWDLELHLREKHPEIVNATRLTNKKDNPSGKLIESLKKLIKKKLKDCDPA